MLFSVSYLISFFLFFVCLFIHVQCADVDMYAVCMLYICACPYGGQKSTLDAGLQMLSTFFEIGSLTDLVLTGSPASTSSVPGVQVCTTRSGLHGCNGKRFTHWAISSDLDSFSCHQHLHILLSNYLCSYVCLPKFPQIILIFTFLSSLSMSRKLSGFCSSEWILGLVVHIHSFVFLTPPRIHIRGHYPGLP